jgi:cytidylate kinase
MLAARLGYVYIDTGAMYRAVTYLALQQKISCEEEEALTRLAAEANFQFIPSGTGPQAVFLNGADVTEKIRSPLVSRKVSVVSSHRGVRRELVGKQQALANDLNVVMDGRDIGTVVLPQAELKIYLTAEAAERARRRYQELLDKGYEGRYEEIEREILQRDEQDTGRCVDPLRPAEDAVVLDTTGITPDEAVNRITKLMPDKE